MLPGLRGVLPAVIAGGATAGAQGQAGGARWFLGRAEFLLPRAAAGSLCLPLGAGLLQGKGEAEKGSWGGEPEPSLRLVGRLLRPHGQGGAIGLGHALLCPGGFPCAALLPVQTRTRPEGPAAESPPVPPAGAVSVTD